MKQLYIFLVLMVMGCFAHAQVIKYTYDAAGNRTQRTLSAHREGKFDNPKDTAILAISKIGVFPNPTQDAVNINIVGYEEGTKASIIMFDMTGKVICNITNAGTNNSIDLYNEAAGSYLVKVTVGDKVSNWRVVKE